MHYTADMFDPVDPRQSFPDLEKGILEYWRNEDMFRRSIEMREGCETFCFYDGPPFATGLPHYGHLLAGTIKDVIPRYQTMRGKQVQRRFGWDCHGLPVENIIEKENNIASKRDIEAMGVRRFNELCRNSVQRYVKEWRSTVERVGRWVDMDWDYRTMDPQFMESIWWVFKSLHDKKLIYEGYKPMHICPRDVTPLSNFEVTQGYKDVTDQSAVVMFELEQGRDPLSPAGYGRAGERSETRDQKTYLLAWTTTPWTLPGNLFVAVGPDVDYVNVTFDGSMYVVAKDRVEEIFKDKEHAISGKAFKGSTLKGKKYAPLFPYFADVYKEAAFRVVTGDFVETGEGTGLVHIAPGFGEDDFEVGKKEKVPLLQHVTMEGKFIDAVTDFAGQDVKPIDDPAKTDRKVVDWLEKHGKLFSKDSYRHSYPHCWRCDSPLLNYATSSWFVQVEKIKKDMLNANAKTEWVPSHIRDGRFGNWLENARDWAISRNRYWGTPLPIWRDARTKEMDVIGSRDELMQRNQIRFTKVTAVRHGEAQHNVGHFYQSAIPGVDLTENGQKQAKAAGTWLANGKKVDVIYCSPLNRTKQTAQAIADATGATVIVDERLREVGVGEYEGKGFDHSDLSLVTLRRQKKLQDSSPESIFHLEGMEKYVDIQKRIADFLDEVLPRHRSEHIVIVSHADPIVNIRHYFTKEDPFKLSHRPFPNFATPESFFWDHDIQAEMDLHKENVDEIMWPSPDSKVNVDLTCVRHGETDWNKQDKVQGGNIDEPLNDTGRGQAAETAKNLKKGKFDVIVTSDLKRAAETAEILSKELGVSIAEKLPLLRERHTGDWSGRTTKEILGSKPGKGVVFDYDTPPNGESFSQFTRRITQAHEHLLEQYAGKRILLVAHRGTIKAIQAIAGNLSYKEGASIDVVNGQPVKLTLHSFMKRIPEVLDCWFESGSMPYAQQHYPFEFEGGEIDSKKTRNLPPNFPAEFIAEGIDQTRGWFYTLTVLSSALYKESAFRNVVVNGTVLAEDGRKMSKRLKNYPEPTLVAEKHGADALRFMLMRSPAVRGEDLRFSEKAVEETVRSVFLPLWNSYSFFVTYANLANFEPTARSKSSAHPLDRWIKAQVQDLVNKMTEQLDAYDLSATCEELFETIDALTNWYIRLSRRRFAGKGASGDVPEAEPENFEQDRIDALNTLYDVLITISQVLAPFSPFMTESIYLNLVNEKHGSIHLTDWPNVKKLTKEDDHLLRTQQLLRTVVSLGLKIRSDKNIKVRTPLAKATIAFPPSLMKSNELSSDELGLLRQELNVKEIVFTDDPGKLGHRFAQVDARKVGPRLGGRVQEIIQAGKRGDFEVMDDGRILILDESLGPDEAAVLYRGREGEDIAALKGIVVSIDTVVTDALKLEGSARDLIRAVQQLRKEAGLSVKDRITLQVENADDLLSSHKDMIIQETNAALGQNDGEPHTIDVDGASVTFRFAKA
jgi:isoleucyl-tRNA synthetase